MAKDKNSSKKYGIKGLEIADHMPVQFRNRTYDLANLSMEDLQYLKQFPEEFPYLTEPTI